MILMLTACLHSIEPCQILIEHHVALANDHDPLLDRWERKQLQRPVCLGLIDHANRVPLATDPTLV